MGEDVESQEFSRQDRQLYREKLRNCLDVFARMLGEVEVRLRASADRSRDRVQPGRRRRRTRRCATPRCWARSPTTTSRPSSASSTSRSTSGPAAWLGTAPVDLETELRASLNDAEERARSVGAHIVMIGMLPTLTAEHLTRDSLSANPRYALINEQIFAARGEDLLHRDRRARSGWRPTPTRSPPRRRAPACSSTCR